MTEKEWSDQQERWMKLEQAVAIHKSTANDTQVNGTHYKNKAIQPWDFIAGNGMGYLEGNVVKYVSRWKEKNGLDDLRKARHYLDKLIEMTEQARA